MIAYDTNDSLAETYGYDALGRRVWISDGSTTNYLVYDGIHVVAKVNSSGELQKSYTWNPQSIDVLLAFTDYTGGSTNTYYTLTDHLGTVHALTDSSGSIVESYRFDAWGRVLGVYDSNGQPLSESAIGNHYLHQGRWYSWKTGLYYHRARWRDPVIGRWLSKDPSGIGGGLNQYVFCLNNPVNYVDPFGDEPYTKEELEAALKAVQSGLELREKQEEALKKGDLKEWGRLQASRDILGRTGERHNKHRVVDDWENEPCAKKQNRRYGREVLKHLFSSKATKKAITTKFEKERQQMQIEYIKKHLNLLQEPQGESIKK